jgi:hypothetical protein
MSTTKEDQLQGAGCHHVLLGFEAPSSSFPEQDLERVL